MTLPASITIATGRAMMAALQPLTGGRAAGVVRMRSKPGTVLNIPRYSYWMPVVDGQRMTSWLFKATDGPNADKSWTVDDSGNSLVTMMSNIGGMRHNVDAGTVFMPAVPIDELVDTGPDAPVAEDDFTGATNPAEYCGVQDMALYQTFDGPALTTDMHRSPLSQFPGILLAFQSFEPADGVAIATNDQAAVNAGSDKKFYKVSYTISVITVKGEGDASRRMEGLIIADTVAALLNDKHAGDQGEPLSNPGGIQVRTMIPEDGPQDIYKKFYIYTVLVSAMVTLERLDFRTFNPWLRTVMNVDVPQLPELPNQGAFELVNDVEIDMTPNQLDLPLDGTFVRATAATLVVPESGAQDAPQLLGFIAGARRFNNPLLGLYMEPAVSNDLGAAAEDLSAWTTGGGAAVATDVENDPLGNLTADRITFAADADSLIEFTGPTVPAGVPVVFYVFAKAPGTKFTSAMRLVAEDSGAGVYVSDNIAVDNVWRRYRFEFTPTSAGVVTLRIQNATDAQARQLMAWGVFYSNAARWGAEYVGSVSKDKDQLTFTAPPIAGQQANLVTPQAVLTGSWALRFRTPDEVSPDLLGTAVGDPVRTLVSVGNGVTELVTLTLTGTPGSGGAELTLTTRSGLQITLPGLEWVPGDELRFVIKATGTLTVEGTLGDDGDYSFARYVEEVDPGDFLVIGDVSTGASSPAPGGYIAVETNV